MAVQVLDFQQSLPSPEKGDASDDAGCEALAASCLQRLVNLLSQSQMGQAQDTFARIAKAAASDLNKLIALQDPHGGRVSRLGHARFRHAPAGSPAPPSSPSLFHSPSSASPAPPLFRISSTETSPATPPSPPLFRMPSTETSPAIPPSSPLFRMPSREISPVTTPSPASFIWPSALPSSREVDANVGFSLCNDPEETRCSPAMADDAPSQLPSSTCHPCADDGHADGDACHANGHVRKDEDAADGRVYDATCTPHGLHPHGHAQSGGATMVQMFDGKVSTAKPLPARTCEVAFRPLRTNSSFVSSVSMEERGGTVSSGKPLCSSGRPPLPPKKRMSPEKANEISRKCHSSRQCHCAHKRRKLQSRTVVRVSGSGTTKLDMPDDGHSWCTYGQKWVEGTPYPRIYYKCSSVRGCPARKHVQCVSEDSSIWIVTYGRRHMHPPIRKVPSV